MRGQATRAGVGLPGPGRRHLDEVHAVREGRTQGREPCLQVGADGPQTGAQCRTAQTGEIGIVAGEQIDGNEQGHGRVELGWIAGPAMGRDAVQEPEQAPMGERRVAPHPRADGRADQSPGDAVVPGQGASQVAAPVDRLDHDGVVLAPGMALAAPWVHLAMGAEQNRRGQQREAAQGLQAALAQRRVEGGQAVVVA